MNVVDRAAAVGEWLVRRVRASPPARVAAGLGLVLVTVSIGVVVSMTSSPPAASAPSGSASGLILGDGTAPSATPTVEQPTVSAIPSVSTIPSLSPSPLESPTPTPVRDPSAAPTAGPRVPHTFRFAEGDDPGADYSVMVEVVDLSGRGKSARHANPDPPEGDFQVTIPDGPVPMGFLPLPTEPNSLVVGWRADPCNTRDRLTVSGDASVIRLASSPSITCPNPHTRGHRIVLAFESGIDISRIRAARGEPFIDATDIRSNALALSTTSDVWIGGWTKLGESFLLHSTNAGYNWTLVALGWGHVLDVAPLGGDDALAAADCAGVDWQCEQGLFGSGSLRTRISSDPVRRLSMRSRDDGMAILGPYPGGGDCCYWLRPTTTTGPGLPEVINPCGAGDR